MIHPSEVPLTERQKAEFVSEFLFQAAYSLRYQLIILALLITAWIRY
jgi:hypothetical protein